ncbi:hypothetical protein [Brasilonema sp. UFV-L1]|uniref:hypothetical protein n=1 Tax=Brasilonema sp. UFV-L1 TaxID=2234130 RepID=UPI00145FBFEF|nr:hypothetical protein [Brasilonema sp. UFV-L1]NMG10820.1 hypothetical protein [Brasilonema sp. UFV-L1]
MANPNPNESTRFKGKWLDIEGQPVETKTVRFPAYLLPQLQAIAIQLHQEEVARQAKEKSA